MAIARQGQTVQVHYTGSLRNGTTFDSSVGREPLEFQIGSRQVIAGFDKAVEGMQEGETKNITIISSEAYGDYSEDLVKEVPNELLPTGVKFEKGMQLQGTSEDGYPLLMKVKEVRDQSIVVDANHELAGEDLNFSIELVRIL